MSTSKQSSPYPDRIELILGQKLVTLQQEGLTLDLMFQNGVRLRVNAAEILNLKVEIITPK